MNARPPHRESVLSGVIRRVHREAECIERLGLVAWSVLCVVARRDRTEDLLAPDQMIEAGRRGWIVAADTPVEGETGDDVMPVFVVCKQRAKQERGRSSA